MSIAYKHKKYIDVVIWYRNKFLDGFKRSENLEEFKKVGREVGEIDDDAIREKKKQAKEEEGGGGGGGGGGSKLGWMEGREGVWWMALVFLSM